MKLTYGMIFFFLILAVIIARNPASFVGATLATGTEGIAGIGALEGGKGTKKTQTGTFKTGNTSIKLGA